MLHEHVSRMMGGLVHYLAKKGLGLRKRKYTANKCFQQPRGRLRHAKVAAAFIGVHQRALTYFLTRSRDLMARLVGQIQMAGFLHAILFD